MNSVARLASAALLLFTAACTSYLTEQTGTTVASNTFEKRTFDPKLHGKWIGNGISYGAYRDGEGPGQGLTSKENILEDLQIIAKRWNLIRLYGADQQSENILEVIAENDLPIRVMQGIWLDGKKPDEENTAQVKKAIELANRFPDIIIAVNAGNEIFVDWSWHRIDDMDTVIEQIRDVRASIAQPVTVADDYNFWNKPHSQKISDEIDFICLHAYAFWNNIPLDNSMAWTEKTYNDIKGHHPDQTIAYCETGWPTSRVYGDGSYEGGLIGKAGEDEQEVFFDQYDPWVDNNRVISFYFTSFDENWKGGFDGANPMDKAEKHWGLYKSDRRPKKALR